MILLDWSGSGPGVPKARVGALAPCKHCGDDALLRHPVTGEPCHKMCEEAVLTIGAAVLAIITARYRTPGGTRA